MKEVLSSEHLMYTLYETAEGRLLLDVVCGGVGWYTAKLLLNEEEAQAFKDEGQFAVDRLALKVCREPSAYSDRTFD